MTEFDDLKNSWQRATPLVAPVDMKQLRRDNATVQQQLERKQLYGAASLLLTALYLLYIGFLSGIPFQALTTYAAIVLIILCCIGQAGIHLYLYQRLRSIDIAAPVTEHLQQWETYYSFRKRLIRINLPVYYVLLNGAFGLYFIEMLGLLPTMTRVLVLVLYMAWMLFAWFVLGKRSLRREDARLTGIMNRLREQQTQLGRY